MQDANGTHFETPDGKAPTHHGSVVSIHTPGGLVPGTWLGPTTGAQRS